jgi:CHAT domain-containing protein/lipopolysaccharide biosynthesis regulator YciM
MTQQSEDMPALDHSQIQGGFREPAVLLTALLLFFLLAVTPSGSAYGRVRSLIQQSKQEPVGSGNEKDARALEAGKPIKSELAGGQKHAYRVRMNADQFLKVIVEQQGIDVAVEVSGPDGKQILEFDSESRPQGSEEVSLVAEAAGAFQLIVSPKLNGAPAGSYEIRIEELRAATDNDRALHDARKQFEEALKLLSGGKYDEALPPAERALEIRERLLGAESLDVAATLDGLGKIYTGRGEYIKAEPLFNRALEIREKVLGKDHPTTADSFNFLAELYIEQGKYAEAESFNRRALEIREKVLGKDHPDTANSFYYLAFIYQMQGKYGEAEPLQRHALDILEKTLGKDHQYIPVFLNGLGEIYRLQGKYAEAEPHHKRALEIREKTLVKDHLYIASSLNILATLYWDQGRYLEAEPLYKRALEIREKKLGKDHPHTAVILGTLGNLYSMQEKYAEAEPFYNRALGIFEKLLSKDHPYIASILGNLATVYKWQGKYEEAEPLYKRALAINEKSGGKDHPDTANSLGNLGELYWRQGKYEEAEPLLKRALEIREKVLGKDHPDTAKSFNYLAALYVAKDDLVQAVKFQSLANAASERNIVDNLVIGSERHKLAYLATLPEQTDRTISLHLRSAHNDPAAGALAATLILQRKGRALDATSQNLNALRSRSSTEDQAMLDRLTETRLQIARLVLGGPQKMTAEQHQARIKELEDQAEKYEADISRTSKEFLAQSLPVTLEAVLTAIPPDSALIEFASYRPFNAKATRGERAYDSHHYVAYVLRHDGKIECRDLGDAKAIDAEITALLKALRDPKRVDAKRLARAVDAKLFQPLRPLLGGKSRLLISPEGSLNLLSFAALVDERGRYAVEDYSISYLTSGRDLLRLQVTRESKDGPLVVAAPDFGRRGQAEVAHSEKHDKDTLEGEVREESARSAINEFYFPPLPHAAQEGEALRALLPGATLLTKGQATKAALNQVHGPRLLHIATHGFFLKDLEVPSGRPGDQELSNDPKRALQQLEQRGVRVENPLLRSGLALAGANEHKEDDNGILTALEVTGLNLWGTKLVTLSACDTGVGEVKNGDGVYGLRRALVLAGAEAQVMSLWAVSDKATRELMVSYYRRLQEGQGRGEALRQSQLEMLKNVNRRHPYYWASFIQSGEWKNLKGKGIE